MAKFQNDIKQIIFVTLLLGAAEGIRRLIRSNRQKKLQKEVNESSPKPIKIGLTRTDSHIEFTILEHNNIDLTQSQESNMSEKEIQEWKSLFSTLGVETTKIASTASTFNGLVKCDVPLKDLCRCNGNPDAMRGLVIKNGKISQQASFTEVSIAPLMVFQCMAVVTSQYYEHIIIERLNAIDNKLASIIKIFKADDRAKLKVSYNRFVELSKKNKYDIADKLIVSQFYDDVEKIKEKYRDMLAGIKNLDIDYKWSDKKEAEQKIKALNDSHYFDYLDMAMQAEVLTFIASVVSMKVARYLGNEEDINIYANRMSLDYWDNYVNQFNWIKHDVINYLEREVKKSWFQNESIKEMMKKQLERFDNVEYSMLELQNQFEYRTVQYIIPQKDGSLKKYLCITKENRNK